MNPDSLFAPSPSLEDRLGIAYLTGRTSLFDNFVASTQGRFWDPADAQYIDFSTPFDMTQPLLPLEHFPELNALAGHVPVEELINYANLQVHRMLSGFYYGEQAAFLTCLKEAEELNDPSAVEYAINQAREESRHQHGFQRYIQARFGTPLPLSPPYRATIMRLLNGDVPQKKFVGVQLVFEGLGLATLGYAARSANDPLLRRLTRLIMADEAQHHKAGRMLIKRELPLMSPQDSEAMAEEALACFKLMEGLYLHAGPYQTLCATYNLEPPAGLILAEHARNPFFEAIFRRNAKTIDDCGLVTAQNRALYAPWLKVSDQDSVQDEKDEQLAAEITAELTLHNAGNPNRHLAPNANANANALNNQALV